MASLRSSGRAAVALAVVRETSAVTPMQKVLSMMAEMKAKGIQEKQDEEVRFSRLQQWCENVDKEKADAIERGAEEIEDQSAEIEQAKADIEELSARISELDEDVARWEDDVKAATDVRGMEKNDYLSTLDDYNGVLDACDRAVSVLRNVRKDVPQSLLQRSLQRLVRSPRVPESARLAFSAFLQQSKAPELAVSAPEANAYESQTGGVQQMLVDLRDKFRDERDALQKEEMEAKFAYETMMSHLRDSKNSAEKEISDKTQQQSEREGDRANAQGAKDEAVRVKAADSLYLTQTQGLCQVKAQDFAGRQRLRAEELEAIDKAMAIISGLDEPAKVAKGGGAASAFAQLRSHRQVASQADLRKALALLRARAAASHSEVLAALVHRAASVSQSSEDPFAKIKGMIGDLITKLMEEANGEADHKGWCDAELATNKQTRKIKSDEVQEMTTTVESLNAEISKLSTNLEDLTEEISKAQEELAEADAQRAEEKAKNNQVVDEANEAADAVGQALAVLRDFYAKAAEATALAQVGQSPAQDAPETFDAPYKGQQAGSGGLVGMLEVLESDFARLSSETATEEAVAQANYEKFRADSEQDMAVNQAEVDHKTNKREQRQQELSITKRTLDKTTDSLDAAVDYYHKALEPSCVDSGMSYEERVANRKDEMQSLEEAYKIISGEDLPSLQDLKAEQLR